MEVRPKKRVACEASELDYVVAQLRALPEVRGVARDFAIGKLILAQLFEGDPKAWRDRRRNKRQSLRGLALRKNCPFSKSTLSQALSTYVTMLELSQSGRFKHVSASHIALVSRLPANQRRSMIDRIEREKWSVREVRQRVTPSQPPPAEPTASPSERALSAAHARVGALHATLHRLADASPALELKTALSDCVSELGALRANIVELEQAIQHPGTAAGAKRKPATKNARPESRRR